MWGAVPMVVILTLLRFAAPPLMNKNFLNVLGDRKKFAVIHEYCGHTPVVFVGSFQDPSLYQFYTGEKTSLIGPCYIRRTQFDIWQFDKEFQGKPAYVLDTKVHKRKPKNGYDLIEKGDVAFHLHKTESFQGANRIRIDIDRYHIKEDSIYYELTFSNPYGIPFVFDHPEFPISMNVAYLQKSGQKCWFTCPIPSGVVIPAGGSLSLSTATEYIPDAPVLFCLDNGVCLSANSNPIKLKP